MLLVDNVQIHMLMRTSTWSITLFLFNCLIGAIQTSHLQIHKLMIFFQSHPIQILLSLRYPVVIPIKCSKNNKI